MKLYSAVRFYDKSHAVVPSKWLLMNKKTTLVFYPPSEVDKYIKSFCNHEETWRTYVVTIVAESSKFNSCEDMLIQILVKLFFLKAAKNKKMICLKMMRNFYISITYTYI